MANKAETACKRRAQPNLRLIHYLPAPDGYGPISARPKAEPVPCGSRRPNPYRCGRKVAPAWNHLASRCPGVSCQKMGCKSREVYFATVWKPARPNSIIARQGAHPEFGK